MNRLDTGAGDGPDSGSAERPELTVIIPTRYRPDSLRRAVESAFAQTLGNVEVVVVDDGSDPPVALAPRPGLRCVRRPAPGGVAAARNTGLNAAGGRWVTFLGDDDRLLPHMASASLEAIGRSTLPPPVAAISGIEVVDAKGHVMDRLIPPTHPRGAHFPLEAMPRGRSTNTKDTLLVERDVLREIGGFDETFPTRDMSDVFLRLNPRCSILGLTTVTYQLSRAPGRRLSRNPAALQAGVDRLIEKHRHLLAAHPQGHADVLLSHARMSLAAGPRRAILPSLLRAFRVAPAHTASVLFNPRRMGRTVTRLRASG